MSDEELASINNGIWLCATHAALIDRDEVRYSPEKLKEWKKKAESNARKRQGGFTEETEFYLELADVKIMSVVAKEAIIKMREFVSVTGMFEAWDADPALATSDLFSELILNAATHGQSKSFSFESKDNVATITYDGLEYSLEDLSRNTGNSGGASTLRLFEDLYRDKVIVKYERSADGKNIIKATRINSIRKLRKTQLCTIDIYDLTGADPLSSTPLFISTRAGATALFSRGLRQHIGCSTVYILMHDAIATPSALSALNDLVSKQRPNRRVIVMLENENTSYLAMRHASNLENIEYILVRAKA